MKKYKKLIIATIIALIFIGTFVFLWQKSQPKEVVYNEFTPEMNEVKKTTIITGKIEPRNEVNIKALVPERIEIIGSSAFGSYPLAIDQAESQ